MTDIEDLAGLVGIGLLGLVGLTLISNNIYQYPAAVTPTPTAKPKPSGAPTAPSTNTPAPVTKGATTGSGNVPAKLGYKGTGNKVAMNKGSNHANGQRYNVNHKFKNYVMIGHFKIGKGQEALNCKTDGPNHGSCTSLPKCVWIEPNLNISSGKLDMTSEWPHPKNHNGMPCPSCKSIGAISAGSWLGWPVAAWQEGPYRHIEAWADKSGTGSSWTKLASEVDKGQITNAELAKRSLFLTGAGLECEIRCHGAKGGDTDIRDCNVFEITPPGGATATAAFAFLNLLEAPVPRRYNN